MSRPLATVLNRDCFCVSLDKGALEAQLRDDERIVNLIEARAHLIADAPVFLADDDARAMLAIVSAVERAVRLPGYRAAALKSVGARHAGGAGAFMGYDFHLTAGGPRLIEVNTNAGGAFINAALARAQKACCSAVSEAVSTTLPNTFDAAVAKMFEHEWALAGRGGPLKRIAIVDDAPREQYLYPEFLLAQRMLERAGYDVAIADAASLRSEGAALFHEGRQIDLVYNRLVDFALTQPAHAALRNAYDADTVVVTPNPMHHALFGDKRNLVRLSDAPLLRAWGLPATDVDLLIGAQASVSVDAENAPQLWIDRKHYFFKPVAGHGGKAVYRGDKITKSAWASVISGDYIAQRTAAPSERAVRIGDALRACKLDVRLYTYDGALLLAAARLYQGQTTNFRTPGGGFAPVLIV